MIMIPILSLEPKIDPEPDLHLLPGTPPPRAYLAAWLDILQTLRPKLPSLVERLLAAPAGGFQLDSRARAVSREGLAVLLRRPWDPAATSLNRSRQGLSDKGLNTDTGTWESKLCHKSKTVSV